MPADYLSRLPSTKETIASISAFHPFQTDLYDLQMQGEVLKEIQMFRNKNLNTSRNRIEHTTPP
jgi:hypothetical protein